jgi:predicted DNA binding CopG/RHH family protein
MKNKQKKNLFDNLVLDKEEQLLEEAFERGEYEEATDLKQTKKMLAEAAAKYVELHTSKPITIRVNQLDLIKVKAKAKRNNIPYQTLLSTLINQYAQGKTRLSL